MRADAGPALVYFYPGADAPPGPQPLGRQWSLTSALSRHVRVVMVSTEREVGPKTVKLSERLTVLRGCMTWSARRPRALKTLFARLDQSSLDAALHSEGVDDHCLWLSSPDPTWLSRGYAHRRLVYDCIDPCLGEHCRAHEIAERRLCEHAGVVFATAEALLDRVSGWNAASSSLPNGCADLGPLAPRPVGPPVVGYLGTVDRRVAIAPLVAAAKALPSCRFVIGGRVNPDQHASVSALAGLPNVTLAGPVVSSGNQALMESFSVGVIPFEEGPIGDALNPVKMYSYLERGIPVAATDIRECRGTPHVHEGPGAEGFVDAVMTALDESSSGRDDRRAFALQNTWEVRAASAVESLQRGGML